VNRPKLSIRRSVALAATGAVIGMAGVALTAAPAAAHHPEISGTYCKTKIGEDRKGNPTYAYEYTWTVGNSERVAATVTRVQPNGVGQIVVGATLPARGEGYLGGTETRSSASGSLTVEAQWKYDKKTYKEARTVKAKSAGTCAPKPTPTPTPTSTPTPEPTTEPTPEPTTEPTPEPTPTETEPTTEPTPEPTPTETEPTTDPTPSEPAPTVPPTDPLPPAEPVFTLEHTCDEMIFGIDNPEGSEYGTLSFVLTPNVGEAQTLTVAPGESKTVSFPASEGLVVTPSFSDPAHAASIAAAPSESENLDGIAWEQPEDCDAGSGGGLPVTGAAAGGIAAGAAVLLAAGAALFITARRRRVRFTA